MAETSPKDTKVKVDGKVITVLPDTKYKIEIEVGGIKHHLIGYPSGKVRQNYIKIMEGDTVVVEIDPLYDLSIGRILFRKDKRKIYSGGQEVQSMQKR